MHRYMEIDSKIHAYIEHTTGGLLSLHIIARQDSLTGKPVILGSAFHTYTTSREPVTLLNRDSDLFSIPGHVPVRDAITAIVNRRNSSVTAGPCPQ